MTNENTIPSKFLVKEIDGKIVRAINPEYDDRIESHLKKAQEERQIEMAELDAAQKADAENRENRKSLVASWLKLMNDGNEDKADSVEIPMTAVELHRQKYPPILVKNQPAYGDYEGTGWMDARGK